MPINGKDKCARGAKSPWQKMELDHIMGFNGFTNLNYNRGNFTAGVRFESYLNTLEGYPTTFQGTGLGYRYANWKNE